MNLMTNATSTSLIRPLTPDERAGRKWTVRINGALQPDVTSAEISAPEFGTVRYGMTPGGYDGWSFAEAGAGGSTIVPFCVDDGRLLIGTIREFRHNLGGEVANVPRGFIDAGETHLAAARRELAEETGLHSDQVFELPGDPVNCNSSFFETPSRELGVRFFAVDVPKELLEHRQGRITFRDDVIANNAVDDARRRDDRIGGTEFVEWTQAAGYRDMFTIAAVGRLLAWLATTGRFKVSPPGP
jgi:8-oxo-dGTP pyrophosphatase MutT (NUDIX family)